MLFCLWWYDINGITSVFFDYFFLIHDHVNWLLKKPHTTCLCLEICGCGCVLTSCRSTPPKHVFRQKPILHLLQFVFVELSSSCVTFTLLLQSDETMWLAESILINHHTLWSTLHFTQPFCTLLHCIHVKLNSRCAVSAASFPSIGIQQTLLNCSRLSWRCSLWSFVLILDFALQQQNLRK